MKFQVVHKSGLWITNISFLYPYQSQFEAERIDYNRVKINGIIEEVIIKDGTTIYAMETNVIEDLYWSIQVFQEPCVHVYTNQQLTDYIYSVPFQNKIHIASRSYVDGNYVYQLQEVPPPMKENENVSFYIGYDTYHYMFNHVPFIITPIRNVMFGRVLNPDGVLIRKTKEIYSQVVGVLNVNARVYIKSKDFSSIPTSPNIARYELINNQGWINVHNNGVSHNVFVEGYVPSNENIHQLQMTIIDFEKTCFMKEDDKCIVCANTKPQCVFVHGETGHSVCCLTCGQRLMEKKMKCPICRQPIEKLIRLF
jgi:hypothetical protein